MKTEFKVPASATLLAACAQFLSEPTVALESDILRELSLVLAANDFEPLEDGFVEWGCVEHGVVDVFAFEGQQVIRVDPKTATVEAM